jgi:hypothetical protein
MINCGNCGGSHDTTKEVLECYKTPQAPKITDNQLGYLRSLLGSRVAPDGFDEIARIEDLTKREASNLIELMLKQPFRSMDDIVPADIPDSRYAYIADNGDPKFFRVATDKQGNRKVQRVLGSPGDFRYTRVTNADAIMLIDKVKDNPGLHGQMFGYLVGACGICGSPLTDPESIELGIGPVCARKYDW